MIALAGDAELDEGNIFEALLEGWKHDVRNRWWVIDYNRQSLDAVVSDRLFGRIDAMFEMMGWRVVTLNYGRLLEAAFARPDEHHLREWIDACPNSLYSALVYNGGEGWREHLHRDLNRYPGIRAILDDHDDAGLQRLMTNLDGHDMDSVGGPGRERDFCANFFGAQSNTVHPMRQKFSLLNSRVNFGD